MGRKSNAPQRKEEIIWALYDCLAASGHEKVTVKDIARKAGLTPGIIHYYFNSKDEIASLLAEAIYEKYSSLIAASVTGVEPGQKMASFIDFIVDNMIFSRPVNRVFFNLLQMGYEREALGSVFKKMFARYRRFLQGVFEEIGAGEESALLAAELIALTEGFSVQIMVDHSVLDQKTVHRLITGAVGSRLAAVVE